MKILFVSSGNSRAGISPIIKNQGTSLQKLGLEITYYTIKGKGFKGYLKAAKPLRAYLKDNHFDMIHAHYSMSAFVASLARSKPLVVSLMGSDVKSSKYFKFFIKLFHRFSWLKIIIKSEDMKTSLGIKGVEIIPNGVDIDKFKPLDQETCKKQLGWDLTKKQILFAANPDRPEKNFVLVKEAIELLNDSNMELKVLKNVPNEEMPVYHNAANVVILTSLWEGSPNVIKEAMSCNCPIVATDVGDIKWVFGNTNGCYLTTFKPQSVADSIVKAYEYRSEKIYTNGRSRILELGLDTETIAKRIQEVYKKVLKSK